MEKADLEQQSVEQLLSLCHKNGVTVPLELMDEKDSLIKLLLVPQASAPDVVILKNYTKPARKRSVDDFVRYFNQRYKAISSILKARKELQNVTSISRLQGKKDREPVAFIGMVVEKKETKTKHTILKLEDPTGQIEVWIGPTKREMVDLVREVVLDEVIGIVGQASNDRVFANNILFPDIPITKELKKGERDCNVVFIGDVEVGSKQFMRTEFENLVQWLSGNLGNEEQRKAARNVHYVVFIGDLVHGVGIYPGQQEDSNIHDIKAQYDEFTKYIKMIPEHIRVLLIAGNHDAGRLQEPQLPIYKDFCEDLYTLPNVTILSNPSMVTIEKSATHPGFDLLLYHGYSLIYYADNIPRIREMGGQKASQEIMKVFLRKRHLAPTHGCNTYVPDADEDPMVIDRVPDFLITGHIHRISYANYNGVTVLNCGCWNDISDEQIKRGLESEPAKLPIVNLRTRELRIMNFYPQKEVTHD